MIAPRLVYDLILDQSKKKPSSPAILAPGKQPISYKELADHLISTSLLLSRMGFESTDRIAVVLPNGPEMATAFLSVSSVCSCAPLNPSYPMQEFIFSMSDLNVKALVALKGRDHPAQLAAKELGIPTIILESDPRAAGIFELITDLPMNQEIDEPLLSKPKDCALVLHTSGTTSRPKIVPLTHENIFFSARNISETYSLSSKDRCLNMMPLFHIHGLIGALVSSLVSGASIVCSPGFQADSVLDWLSGFDINWYSAVPTIHMALLEQARLHPERLEGINLRFLRSSSSSLAPQLARDLESIFNCPVLEAYGMTEATHQMASNPTPPRKRKFGSVGPATGTTSIAILDEKGISLKPGESGEICIRGENVMGGYENNPKANEDSFINGWLRTGDKGMLDEDGYLWIQSRIKELINRGGEKISPREIDEVLLSHPAVKQVVTFAIPHPSLGEDVAAAIVLEENQSISIQELRKYAARNLVDFKLPRFVVFLEEIPKGPTGKMQRIGLAVKLKEQLDKARKMETSSDDQANTKLESEIQDIWQQALNIESIGLRDDFLALGGDSLKAGAILNKVNEKYGLSMSMIDLFDAPTISELVEKVQIALDSTTN